MKTSPHLLRQRLMAALSSGRFQPAWIFVGQAEETLSLARYMAAALVCRSRSVGGDAPIGPHSCGTCLPCRKVDAGNHPDVAVADTQPGPQHIDRFRRLAADAWVRPGEADVKVYILPDAGRITPLAQNTLLKLLEDPPPSAVFFLLCRSPDELLPTVRSRCRTEYIGRGDRPRSPAGPEAVRFLEAMAGGELAAAEWAVKAASLKREEAVAVLSDAASQLRPGSADTPALYEALLDAIEALEGNSMIASALMALAVRCTTGEKP
jgi:DNA polymerase III delta prime subunit